MQFYIFYKFKCVFITYFWDKCVLRHIKHAMWSVVACYPPEDGLRTETRVGECIDINKNYKVVYVCVFVGYWILSENARWKRYKKMNHQEFVYTVVTYCEGALPVVCGCCSHDFMCFCLACHFNGLFYRHVNRSIQMNVLCYMFICTLMIYLYLISVA
jgi:hypothetical protein